MWWFYSIFPSGLATTIYQRILPRSIAVLEGVSILTRQRDMFGLPVEFADNVHHFAHGVAVLFRFIVYDQKRLLTYSNVFCYAARAFFW